MSPFNPSLPGPGDTPPVALPPAHGSRGCLGLVSRPPHHLRRYASVGRLRSVGRSFLQPNLPPSIHSFIFTTSTLLAPLANSGPDPYCPLPRTLMSDFSVSLSRRDMRQASMEASLEILKGAWVRAAGAISVYLLFLNQKEGFWVITAGSCFLRFLHVVRPIAALRKYLKE